MEVETTHVFSYLDYRTMIGWASFQSVGKEEEYVRDALSSGWVSHGPYVDKLESKIGDTFGCEAALAVSNGTAALMLAFQTLDIQAGDRVIVPAFAFQAAANVLLQLGAQPVFCDVDPLSWNQTLENVAMVLDHTIKGVVVVHNYGAAADIGPISQLCRKRGIWLIEDAAEAWFTKYRNKYVGQFGDVATLSMHATKTIACGEGGVVLINRRNLVEKAKLHRSHGLDRNRVQYKHVLAGNNYRLSNLLAAVAVAQLEQFESILARQAKRTNAFRQLLASVPGLTFQRSLRSARDELWADAIILDPAITGIWRDDLIDLAKREGVDMRPGFYTPRKLKYYHNYDIGATPVADQVSANIFVLPCDQFMTDADIIDVADVLTSSINQQPKPNRFVVCDILASNLGDCDNLQTFLDNLSQEENGFRYYERRKFDVLENHLRTLLVFSGNDPIGYGHLDREADKVWLGIAIQSSFTGKKTRTHDHA